MLRLALTLLLPLMLAAEEPSIKMDAGTFRVTGWQDGGEFAVRAGGDDAPTLLGSTTVEGGVLVFRPRFPISPGMHVRASLKLPGRTPIEATFDLPKAAPLTPSTRVAHVYPSTNLLPENELKFYLLFSAPMQRGHAWEHVHLLDANGKAVDLPFLELDEELWNPDLTRLTVLFDPGRIKRGLVPINEIGPAIEAGKRYTLLVDRAWLDGRGAPLVEEFRKEFRVGPADREPPVPTNWRVTAPKAGTMDRLSVRFPEPLDYALLQHSITVEGVTGKVEVDRDETEWRFTPERPWTAGEHTLVIQTTLEDLAGNHIGRPFDIDVFKQVSRTIPKETASLKFRIGR